jgi:steroid 5-alpha reductase family enzyme
VNAAALLPTLAVSAAAVAALMLATFAVGLRVGRHSVVDAAWGAAFVLVAAACVLTATGDPARAWLLFGLTAVWGVRLAVHIGRRGRGKGEDPRYERLLSRAPGNPHLYALRIVYLLQGALVLLGALPVQAAAHTTAPLGPLATLGVLVWLAGFVFESVGDAQLARFKRDPANRGRIMDRGLWAWTRHPNYFGDACVWWGLFLVALDGSWWVLLTLPAPLVMTYLLTRGSGQRLLDEHMAGRPGWADYARRTSAFVPLPPKRGSGGTR